MDITEDIGLAAGKVWSYLKSSGESTPVEIKASLELTNTMLYLALGWLAREEKVNIKHSEHSYRISLK